MKTKKRKTREQKAKTQYRLQEFTIKAGKVKDRKDLQAFGYLSSDYIKGDLKKTVAYSFLIIAVELYLARVL